MPDFGGEGRFEAKKIIMKHFFLCGKKVYFYPKLNLVSDTFLAHVTYFNTV